MVTNGLKAALTDLIPAIFELPTGEKVKITIDEAAFAKPSVPIEAVGVKNQKILPTECRQRAATYKGDFKIRMTITVDGKSMTVDRSLGNLPIMIKVSNFQHFSCRLKAFNCQIIAHCSDSNKSLSKTVELWLNFSVNVKCCYLYYIPGA